MSHQIPGMPVCGQCKQCGGPIHFAHEAQQGMLCGACGPGGCNYRGNDRTRLSDRQKQLALEAAAQPAAAPAGVNGQPATPAHITHDPGAVAAALKTRGVDPNQCQFCLLKDNGMNVDSSIVPHKDGCPRASERQ